METSKFLKRVLVDGGRYCLFAAKIGTKINNQTFHTTVESLLSASYKLDKSGYDVYFAMGSFDDEGSRKTNNVLLMGSLFIDIDCGEGKPYADSGEVLVALKSFCKTVGMPQPLLVNSGYGVHAYWPLTEAMSIAEWRPVAVALKRACSEHGLMIDNGVTADAARVLRIPGSHNYKYNTSADVHVIGVSKGDAQSLAWFSDILDADAPAPALMVPSSLFGNVKMTIADDPVMQKLLRNRESHCGVQVCRSPSFAATVQRPRILYPTGTLIITQRPQRKN